MALRIPAKVLLHVWSYDFYDMTLSTGKQRRHKINKRQHWTICVSKLCNYFDRKALWFARVNMAKEAINMYIRADKHIHNMKWNRYNPGIIRYSSTNNT